VEAFLRRHDVKFEQATRDSGTMVYHAWINRKRLPALHKSLGDEFAGTSLTFAKPQETGSQGLEIATLLKDGEKILLYFLKPAPGPAKAGKVPRRPAEARAAPRLAVCIDDLGYGTEAVAWFEENRFPLNAAVLPHLPQTRETARRLLAAGVEVLCHLPMQPDDYPEHDPGPGAILLGTSEGDVRRLAREAFDNIPGLSGFNNHMGSAVTAQSLYMRWIFAEAKPRHLYFLDSRTTPQSVAEEVGKESGLTVFRRHVFLDDVTEPSYIRGKLNEACAIAREQGLAVVIGHPHPVTLKTLATLLPDYAGRVKLVHLSESVGR